MKVKLTTRVGVHKNQKMIIEKSKQTWAHPKRSICLSALDHTTPQLGEQTMAANQMEKSKFQLIEVQTISTSTDPVDSYSWLLHSGPMQ